MNKKIHDKNTEDDKPKSNNGYQSIRLVTGLIFVSITVYYAFRVFVCEDKSLVCKSVYEWEEILMAIFIVLMAIIGTATLTAILFKLFRRSRKSGISWSEEDS